MSKLKIVTDSSATMEPSLRDELEIHVMPLSVMVDGVVYPDDDHLSGEQFMTMMKNSKELPKTSQPPIGQFVELYDELGKDGSDILSIHMTSTLSGTIEAARQASQLSKSNVTVIETDMIDQGLSFCVIHAARLAQAGKTLAEVVPEVQRVLDNTKLYIGVSTMENLVKGGRVSRVVGILSSILNMRVVMELQDGELLPIIKGRGAKTFTKWFDGLKTELKSLPNLKQIGISYAGGYDQVLKFKEELTALFPTMTIPLIHTTPIVSTHTGENAFAIIFYTD